MTNPTPVKLLIEDRLGEPVDEFIKARRPVRVPSWRELAEEIATRTGVAISDETLRLWATDAEDRAA